MAAWGGPATAAVIAFAWTWPAWGRRPAAGDDVMAHLVRAQWGIDHLWLHGHPDGLLPSFAGGYQEFLFFGQGFTALLGAVRLLSLGALSTPGALKVVTIGSLVVFPLAAAFLARSMGLSRRAAGVAAVLSLLVNNPFGVGPSAVFGPSLVPQQVGAILACVCVGGVLRTLGEPRTRWTVLTAVAGALIVVTHVITAFIVLVLLVAVLPTLVVTDRPSRRAMGQLLLAGGAAAGLAGVWVVPFLAHLSLHGPVTTWATPPLHRRLGDIWSGRYLVRPRVAWVLSIGAVVALARVLRRRRWALALVTGPVGFVLASRALHELSPHNPIAVQIENRGIGLAAVVATFGAAAILAWASRRLGFVGDVLVIAAAAGFVLGTSLRWSTVAAEQPVPTIGLAGAANVLRTVLAPGARFAEVRQFPQDVVAGGGVGHPDFTLVWASGHPALNEFNAESTNAVGMAFSAEQLLGEPADVAAETLLRYGVAAVVASNPAAAEQLLESSRFHIVWQVDGWTVMQVIPEPGHPDPSTFLSSDSPASARLESTDPAHLRLTVTAPSPTDGAIAVAWSPRWRLRVDGRAVPTGRTPDGLVAVHLPAGSSTLALDWSADPWTAVGVALSAATLLGGLLALVRRPIITRAQREERRAA